MAAGSLAIVAATGALFAVYERQSGPQMLLTFPEMVWEVTFGVYLIAKGFTSPTTQREAEPRHATTAVPVIGGARLWRPKEVDIYLQRIDSAEIIDTVHARRAPVVTVSSTLRP
jgi:hypothetical protein